MSGPRVLVIGQGPAGLAAASLLAGDADVTIVANSQGSLGFFSATLDFRSLDGRGGAVEDPYRAWEDEGRGPAGLLTAVGWKRIWGRYLDLLREVGIPYPHTLPEKNTWVISASGAPRRTYLAPDWLLALPEPEPIAFLEIPGLPDTPSHWLSANFEASTGLRASTASLADLAEPWDVMRWAGYLDRPEGIERLLTSLNAVTGVSRDLPWVMPGVLGIRNTERLLERCRHEGFRLYEMASVPPSVAGVRLDERWRAHLRRQGVRWRSARVIRIGEGRAELRDGSELPFDALVRATGGILGGGIAVRSDFVAVDMLTGEELGKVMEGVPASFGLSRDEPLAAGADVGGSDPARWGDGMAHVLATAYLAASAVRKRLGLGALEDDEEMTRNGK